MTITIPQELVTVLTGFAIVAAVALVVIFVTKRAKYCPLGRELERANAHIAGDIVGVGLNYQFH